MKWSSIHEFEASSQHVEGRRRETKIMFAENSSRWAKTCQNIPGVSKQTWKRGRPLKRGAWHAQKCSRTLHSVNLPVNYSDYLGSTPYRDRDKVVY